MHLSQVKQSFSSKLYFKTKHKKPDRKIRLFAVTNKLGIFTSYPEDLLTNLDGFKKPSALQVLRTR